MELFRVISGVAYGEIHTVSITNTFDNNQYEQSPTCSLPLFNTDDSFSTYIL